MTFEEWWSDAIWGNEDFKRCCEIAWEAAVKSEREACAKVCEDIPDEVGNVDEYYSPLYAKAIRNRGTAT